MKTIVMLGFLSLVSSTLFAQVQKEATIPADVIDAFSMLYPKAKDVTWKLIEKDFEASFVQNEKGVSLVFDQSGNLLMVKNKIDHTELPVPVIAKLKTEYPDWSARKTFHMNSTGMSSYEVELEEGGEKINLRCSRQGDLVKILSEESLK